MAQFILEALGWAFIVYIVLSFLRTPKDDRPVSEYYRKED